MWGTTRQRHQDRRWDASFCVARNSWRADRSVDERGRVSNSTSEMILCSVFSSNSGHDYHLCSLSPRPAPQPSTRCGGGLVRAPRLGFRLLAAGPGRPHVVDILAGMLALLLTPCLAEWSPNPWGLGLGRRPAWKMSTASSRG